VADSQSRFSWTVFWPPSYLEHPYQGWDPASSAATPVATDLLPVSAPVSYRSW